MFFPEWIKNNNPNHYRREPCHHNAVLSVHEKSQSRRSHCIRSEFEDAHQLWGTQYLEGLLDF